ncbi:hypothetical protein T265_03032 [Opisthorchis viverrini]|uniref:Uncharacterized protein n=1 Tax=Opisthorchis viverrini TaxID=6198 RepID=A0A074ZTV7_OPIVI|nr:hypothetical protein T265_03032 [Opisthorchis viverrini]KER30551.1 hypothetical protein T265_03032 [Opisthorchis viverrini]
MEFVLCRSCLNDALLALMQSFRRVHIKQQRYAGDDQLCREVTFRHMNLTCNHFVPAQLRIEDIPSIHGVEFVC